MKWTGGTIANGAGGVGRLFHAKYRGYHSTVILDSPRTDRAAEISQMPPRPTTTGLSTTGKRGTNVLTLDNTGHRRPIISAYNRTATISTVLAGS